MSPLVPTRLTLSLTWGMSTRSVCPSGVRRDTNVVPHAPAVGRKVPLDSSNAFQLPRLPSKPGASPPPVLYAVNAVGAPPSIGIFQSCSPDPPASLQWVRITFASHHFTGEQYDFASGTGRVRMMVP